MEPTSSIPVPEFHVIIITSKYVGVIEDVSKRDDIQTHDGLAGTCVVEIISFTYLIIYSNSYWAVSQKNNQIILNTSNQQHVLLKKRLH